jgi:AcrR family transcriptional regulator
MSQARSPSPAQGPPRKIRRRDAAASKQALFDAARELFGKKGFERTTVREIGELAGADTALIAYYFGSKADLYVTVVMADRLADVEPSTPEQLEEPFEELSTMIDSVLRRSDEHGPGPILQALVRLDTSEEIRVAARTRLLRQLVEPLADNVGSAGKASAQLRAEVAISALLGISLGRSLGWFEKISAAPRDEVVALVTTALDDLLENDPPDDLRSQPAP